MVVNGNVQKYVLYSLKILWVKISKLSDLSFKKIVIIFKVLQVTNNALKVLITNGSVSLNQRLEISFKMHLWRIKIFKSKIFKVKENPRNPWNIHPQKC